MRVAVIGGTGFIGRAIVADLEAAGHAVLVVHRGEREVESPSASKHAHLDRHDVSGLVAAFDRFEADALIDGIALTARDADEVLTAAPGGLRMLALSSIDVYRAFGALHAGTESDPLPIDETSAVRSERYLFRGKLPGMDEYEKLDVEERFLWRGATIIRLPMVYGEHDPQRREEPVLRRIRAGRARLPIGAGNWLCTRGYVGEMARGVRLALESGAAAGEVFNLGEARTVTMRALIEQIVAATGQEIELARVDDRRLPPDLGLTAAIRQHLVCNSSKARERLGWVHADPSETVRRSVRWHLEHPPAEIDSDFSADDAALAASLPQDA
jgi:nucleoside-diphosphate-sugar epimerase